MLAMYDLVSFTRREEKSSWEEIEYNIHTLSDAELSQLFELKKAQECIDSTKQNIQKKIQGLEEQEILFFGSIVY